MVFRQPTDARSDVGEQGGRYEASQDRQILVISESYLSVDVLVELYRDNLSAVLGQFRHFRTRDRTIMQNNMPPRRSSAAARAVAATAAAATPMTAAAGTEGVVVLSQWFEKMESVFHISNYAVENQVKFATCTFLGNALTWWNSHMKTVTQDVAYAMDWKAAQWGNVMSYQPKTMEKAIKFANDQMDQKVLTITKRQAEQKRKLEFNVRNNQGHQQQNKRQNTRRAYTAGPGEKREYTRSLPLYSVMSSASSAVTYTSVYTDSEPGRVFWGADKELSDGGPEHPSSPNYVPGPEHPPSPVEVPYVPEPEYPEYLVPSDAEAPLEDQPLPADASPIALSLGYVADFDPDEDPKEDPKEDQADYPADGGDGDDDDDDDDTDDEDEEPFEDDDDDEEEEEHLALADSSVVPVVDPVPLAGDTEAFEMDESAPTPRSPQTKFPFAHNLSHLCHHPWRHALLSYRAAGIRLRASSPSTHHPLHPSSPHLPPLVPTSLPLPSSPLPPLPASLFIPSPVDRREDIPEAELPP
ncbi:hypothetical protein Tco_0904414, partial [Tanacetum coccineum]